MWAPFAALFRLILRAEAPCCGGDGQSLAREALTELLHIERHDLKVMESSRAVHDVTFENGFPFETEPFEAPDGAVLVDRHLGDDFEQATCPGHRESLLGQERAESDTAQLGSHQETKFTDVPRPRHPVLGHRRVAN